MNVMIVGGTGFLGHHATLELLKRGHQVRVLALPDIPLGGWHPQQAPVTYGDVFTMPREDLIPLFRGCDALVYAVGPDDRIVPPAPALQYFHDRLVTCCTRVVEAARDAGVKRCVVLGSYFCHFARMWPGKHLAQRHAYIRCRIEQEESVIAAGLDRMAVCVLELPYVFGAMPGRVPLWKDVLIARLQRLPLVAFPPGGANMIAVGHVGEAIAGAVERGSHAARYLVGDVNLTWREMLAILLPAMGKKKRVLTIPTLFAMPYGWLMKRRYAMHGKEAGLDPACLFQDLLSEQTYFDPTPSVTALGYGRGGVEAAIISTVEACVQKRQDGRGRNAVAGKDF